MAPAPFRIEALPLAAKLDWLVRLEAPTAETLLKARP